MFIRRLSAQPQINKQPAPPPTPHNNNNNKTEVDEKSWLLFPFGPICFSTFYDPFVDVTQWDIYEATPESSLNDLTDDEIEID